MLPPIGLTLVLALALALGLTAAALTQERSDKTVTIAAVEKIMLEDVEGRGSEEVMGC